jgi:hypothetical protein
MEVTEIVFIVTSTPDGKVANAPSPPPPSPGFEDKKNTIGSHGGFQWAKTEGLCLELGGHLSGWEVGVWGCGLGWGEGGAKS